MFEVQNMRLWTILTMQLRILNYQLFIKYGRRIQGNCKHGIRITPFFVFGS